MPDYFDWKNLADRAFKTFVQAFLVAFYFPVQAWTDLSAWQAALAGAFAAGLSAVWNLVQNWWSSSRKA